MRERLLGFGRAAVWRILIAGLVALGLAGHALAGVEDTFDQAAKDLGATPAVARLITDNQDAWYARWTMLEGAHQTIDTTYFILEDDLFGRAFLGELVKKAHEGVKIRLMIDARGNGALSRFSTSNTTLRELAVLPGVQVKIYNPVAPAVLPGLVDVKTIMASNHQKLIITDGQWVITGGRNISRDYLASPKDNPAAFRDTDVLIEGGEVPVQAREAFDFEFEHHASEVKPSDFWGRSPDDAADLEAARMVMQAHMMALDGKLTASLDLAGKTSPAAAAIHASLDEASHYPHLTELASFEPLGGQHPRPMFLLAKASHREKGVDGINRLTMDLIDSAQEEIVIQNPYVVFSDEGRAALARAARRGVSIILNTNSATSTNHLLTQAAFISDFAGLMRDIPTLRVYALNGDALLHAKVVVIDRKVALVGTYNMDPISRDINAEDVVAVRAREFAQQCVNRIQEDLSRSTEYTVERRPDGSVRTIVGPMDGIEPSLLHRLDAMKPVAHLLRPVL